MGNAEFQSFSLEVWSFGPGGSPALLWDEGLTGAGIPDTGPDLSGHS